MGDKQTRHASLLEQGEFEEVTRITTKAESASFATTTVGLQTREISLGDNELESALHSSPSSCQILPDLRLMEDGVRCILEKRSPFAYGFVLLVE